VWAYRHEPSAEHVVTALSLPFALVSRGAVTVEAAWSAAGTTDTRTKGKKRQLVTLV